LSKHLGSFAIALFVVWNKVFTLEEPLLQHGVVLEEAPVEAALNKGGKASHKDQVGQRNGICSSKETEIK